MIEHDPFCNWYGSGHTDWTCECDLIAKVRADEHMKAGKERDRMAHWMKIEIAVVWIGLLITLAAIVWQERNR